MKLLYAGPGLYQYSSTEMVLIGLDTEYSKRKVNYTDIAVRSLTCHTATGTHMPYGITQCHLPLGRGDILAFTQPKLVLD